MPVNAREVHYDIARRQLARAVKHIVRVVPVFPVAFAAVVCVEDDPGEDEGDKGGDEGDDGGEEESVEDEFWEGVRGFACWCLSSGC